MITPIWVPDKGTFLHECKYCGTKFHGRENKLFCTAACKSRHNNEIGAKKRKAMKDVSMGILQNARILEKLLNGQDSLHISKEELESNGFDVNAPSKRVNLPSGHIGFQYQSLLLIADQSKNDYVINKIK